MVKSVISSVFTASTMVLSLEPAAVKTEGAEKDILIERKKLLQRFGSKEMPAIVILA